MSGDPVRNMLAFEHELRGRPERIWFHVVRWGLLVGLATLCPSRLCTCTFCPPTQAQPASLMPSPIRPVSYAPRGCLARVRLVCARPRAPDPCSCLVVC